MNSYRVGSECQVAYDRTSRQWLAVNGHVIARVPAGPDGKRAAIEAVIRFQFPALAAAVDRLMANEPENEDLRRRIWKAAQIVANDQVEMVADRPPTVAKVASQSQAETTYWIYGIAPGAGWHWKRTRHSLACTCPDYRDGQAPELSGHRLCKHILAACLARRVWEVA